MKEIYIETNILDNLILALKKYYLFNDSDYLNEAMNISFKLYYKTDKAFYTWLDLLKALVRMECDNQTIYEVIKVLGYKVIEYK